MSGKWRVGTTGNAYSDFVWKTVMSTAAFASFRRNPAYTSVLEHVTEDQGKSYLRQITDPLIRGLCIASEAADSVGQPAVCEFEGKMISPTTLRYGKVLQDLVNAFPDFHNARTVVEIGIGYGGQARMISEYVKLRGGRLRHYYLVDILPVIHLAKLYLEHFSLAFNVRYMTKSDLRMDMVYDLAISNYAFSEFNRPLQAQYIELALRRARGGYLTMNTGLRSGQAFNRSADASCYTVEELMSLWPNSVILNEVPETGRHNYILIYGRHAVSSAPSLEAMRATVT